MQSTNSKYGSPYLAVCHVTFTLFFLLSVSCPVAVFLLHCGASVTITNSSLVCVNIPGNKAHSHSLIVLYRLNDCGVTDEGCDALASALRSNPSHLIQLNLSGNKIGDLGVKRLSAVLEDPHCKLEKLW